MKRVLIIDDFFGRELLRGRQTERESLCRRLRVKEFGAKGVAKTDATEPLGLVLFFRGQKPAQAKVGDIVENDLAGCLRRVELGAPDGEPWDLLMLDLCFYTGAVTDESDADFAGFPEGRPKDDDPDNFFGLEVLAAVKKRFPELPVVVFSAHSGENVKARVHDLGALRFIARDDAKVQAALAEVLSELARQPTSVGPTLRDSHALLEMARTLPPPTAAELQNMLPVLKELESVLLHRALHGALLRSRDAQGLSLLPALKLLTGQESMTTSQAADFVKRLVHQTRPHESLLLNDGLIREAYEMSVRLRPGATAPKRHDDD